MGAETKTCQNCKNQFTIEPEDFEFYKKISVPAPTWCWPCRRIRRMMFRNERALYRDTCDLCGKSTLSTYAPDSPYTVYCRDCWFSDKWNALDYGVAYDFSRPFFEQFQQLKRRVPRIAMMHLKTNTNAAYANYVAESKNVYLAYSIVRSEDVMYSRVVDDSRDCVDCSDVQFGELVYEAVQSDSLNRVRYAYSCAECIEAAFLFDCVNCQNCFMSSNLRSKRYVFRNRQLSKEEYLKKIGEIDFGSYATMQELIKEYLDLIRSSLHKYGDLVKTVNCTGENILASKNVRYSFDIQDGENAKYCDRLLSGKDSYDIYGSATSELNYESLATGFGSSGLRFCIVGDNSQNLHYSDYCIYSSNLFGCIGVGKKSHCILNRQYTRGEYEALVPKIIAHMSDMPYTDPGGRAYRYGEFFPPYQYAYNETIAQEDAPFTKDEALARGYRWRDPEAKAHAVTLPPEALADHIREVGDSVLGEVIGCAHEGSCNEQCTRAFKVTPQELQFYRRMTLTLPRFCPNCRHYARLRIRNPHALWRRRCTCAGAASENGQWRNTAAHFHGAAHCPNEFETSYAPGRPEVVYCEKCYQAEVA